MWKRMMGRKAVLMGCARMQMCERNIGYVYITAVEGYQALFKNYEESFPMIKGHTGPLLNFARAGPRALSITSKIRHEYDEQLLNSP